MRGIRVLFACSLWNAATLIAADSAQFVISTYAGGAPAPPSAALALAADGHGNAYFVDGLGYTGTPARSNSVYKIDSGGVITRIAGNSRTGFTGDGGPGAAAALNYPLAVAVDRLGNVFIVDAGNQRVRRVAPDGTITTAAGGGHGGFADGPATSGQLYYPSSIAVDGDGNLFIGELGRVRKVTPDGNLTTVAGGGPNSPTDGAVATTIQLTNAVGVAVDASGNIFIADQDLNDDNYSFYIRKVSPAGIVTTLPHISTACCTASIATDSNGNLLVSGGTRILRISPDGAQGVVAGNGTYGLPSGDGQPATKAQLNGPSALAVNPGGDLLIADNAGRNIRIVTPDGIIHAFASIPGSSAVPSGDRGPAMMANLQLAVPGLSQQSGLATDAMGNLYIAETAAHRVRKVLLDGTIITVAGVGGPPCTAAGACLPLGDGGPATAAALSYPTSVAVDGAGNLFIADSGNSRVRKVAPDGTITTYAGNGNAPGWPPAPKGDGGPATSAPLVALGVAVDRAGNLLIAEGNNADVRKVSPDGTINTVYYPSGLPYFGSITALTVDAAGNLFVAGAICDSDESCFFGIRRISPSGESTLIAGNRKAYSLQPGEGIGDGGPSTDAPIGFVAGLAADGSGNLFLADLFAQRVRRIDGNGIISTVGGDGIPGYSGDGGPAANASVYYPLGLATDSRGNVYVSDFNQSVRVLRPVSQ